VQMSASKVFVSGQCSKTFCLDDNFLLKKDVSNVFVDLIYLNTNEKCAEIFTTFENRITMEMTINWCLSDGRKLNNENDKRS